MAQTRADFLKGALRFGALGALAPTLIMEPHLAERVLAAGGDEAGQKILVVINLSGGNDGLNTVVPYGDGLYYQKRPTLAIPQAQVLKLDGHIGLNPNLKPLKALYDQGKMAVVQGVGYPEPNLSHFRSADIWQSAQPRGATDTGWLGRLLDSARLGVRNPLAAIGIGPLLPKALWSRSSQVPAVQSLESFTFKPEQYLPGEAQALLGTFQRLYSEPQSVAGSYLSLVQLADAGAYQATVQLKGAGQVAPKVPYPGSEIAKGLKLVSQVIASNLGTRIFMLTQGSYDDHADEASAHARLLGDLGSAIGTFYQDMTAQGRADQVLLLTFSEFGRRPLENASNGTDHGTAAPMLAIGGTVKGGLYGQQPSLADLEDGNLKFGIDFRSVYSTVVSDWLGLDPAQAVLGRFPIVPFL